VETVVDLEGPSGTETVPTTNAVPLALDLQEN